MWTGPSYPGEFPSLGWVAADWVEAHCVVPDRIEAGSPFVLPDQQLTFMVHHYRLDPKARPTQLAPAFHYRRSQLVRPQKWGKSPLMASLVLVEAIGPALFAGWAKGGETWDCRDHHCDCGWVYEYEPGEPMGRPWPTPLIQITATSDDQADNVYHALRPMIELGPLASVLPKTGEEFIRTPGGGRIDTVTANHRSRLGQRVTFVAQDETGIWTPLTGMVKVADTQRRGLAGMGGRAVEITNPWDPTEQSVAQQTAEARAKDIYLDHRPPPPALSYLDKRERHRIHAYVYAGAPWVDLAAIEAEAAEILERDPAQAERFFGNRVRGATQRAFDLERWNALTNVVAVPAGTLVTVGVDGARFDDALAIVATTVDSGYQWPLGIWERPEGADPDYEHPADEADRALTAAFDEYNVWRCYIDPQWIDHLFNRWRGRWGEDRIRPWYTNRDKAVGYMLRNYRSAMTGGDLTHDGDETLTRHIGYCRRRKLGVRDDEGRPLWTVTKESPTLKIDGAMAGALSWEARGDAIAAGAKSRRKTKAKAAFL